MLQYYVILGVLSQFFMIYQHVEMVWNAFNSFVLGIKESPQNHDDLKCHSDVFDKG